VGIVNPRLSAFRTPESDFYTAAFAQAGRTLPSLDAGYVRCGALHIAVDEEKDARFARAAENWGWGEHMCRLAPQEASEIAGVAVDRNALFLPEAAQLDPAALCRAYARGLEVEAGAAPEGAVVLLASGAAAGRGLPIHTVRGQITLVRANERSAGIKTNIGYGGYISAPVNGLHAVGATFQKWMTETQARDEDDASNLKKLEEHIAGLGPFEIVGHRAALRTASQDRFPVIGDMDGRYVSTAHGSHGIASTLAGAHAIADMLRGGIRSLGKSTLNKLAPQRFEERERRKNAKKA
jgi:tRNA 5-methylaminomethyl-2-thiouridine biosynthesis bifunctional protein